MCIVLDPDLRAGHGRCYFFAPELFDTDDEVRIVKLARQVPVGLESQARLAVHNCPERCFSIEE